jgi:ComF family protein
MLKEYFNDFLALFFPELCGACAKNLFKGEAEICTSCIYKLPLTANHNDPNNKVARQFWGRISFLQAGAYLHFKKGGRVQALLHQIKYRKREQLGVRLGELYGYDLSQSANFIKPDLIIPVPLHPKKLKMRGYNQSEAIAKGLSKVLQVDLSNTHLIRNLHTESQTKKSRFSRYENMQEAFSIHQPEELEGKHILLIDDVITTGSTLEACALCLQEKAEIKLSLAALAYAD